MKMSGYKLQPSICVVRNEVLEHISNYKLTVINSVVVASWMLRIVLFSAAVLHLSVSA